MECTSDDNSSHRALSNIKIASLDKMFAGKNVSLAYFAGRTMRAEYRVGYVFSGSIELWKRIGVFVHWSCRFRSVSKITALKTVSHCNSFGNLTFLKMHDTPHVDGRGNQDQSRGV